MAKMKKYYTQIEVDEYVRRLLTDSEIALSKQSERLEKERKENERLLKELEESKNKEKAVSRLLILSERKAKYLETTAKEKCDAEIEKLAKLVDESDLLVEEIIEEYDYEDEDRLEKFKAELSAMLDGLIELGSLFGDVEASQTQAGEINRLNVLRNKKKTELDDRFSKLVMEFNMKIGGNATRGRGRPKKQDSNNVSDIEKMLKPKQKQKTTVYPPKGENGFDYEEALNPTDSLEDIMKDLID